MSGDPYKQLEDQLRGAVDRRRPARRWLPRGVVPIVAVAAVLGTGAATAAVVLRPDDRPENQVRQALFAGTKGSEGLPACRRSGSSAARSRMVDDPVPAAIAERLGVFRRPATAADRLPLEKLRLGGTEILGRSVRVARASDGWRYRLYLSRGVPAWPGAPRDPLACAQARRDASVAAAEGFPEAVRGEVAALVDREVRAVAAQVSGRDLMLGTFEVRPDGRSTGGGVGRIREKGRIPAFGSIGLFRRGHQRYVALSGLVPDGVARVRVVDGNGAPRERAVTIAIRDNVYHALLPRRMGPRMTVEWRDEGGHVVRRTHPHY